jgi:hypothetical protein
MRRPGNPRRIVKPSKVMSQLIHGVSVPDGKIAQEITELVRDTVSPLLFNHSSRVYYFGALAGKRRGLLCHEDA